MEFHGKSNPANPNQVRINKLLSRLGVASRRKADELISQGAVSLNGRILKAPGVIVDTAKDRIAVFGRELVLAQAKRYSYFLVNKPKGHISTVSDTHSRKTILRLVPEVKGLFPVGRLDKDTTGLIIVTNDGELAHRLMHPRYKIEKVYEVDVLGALSNKDISHLEEGVDIGDRRPSVCKVQSVKRRSKKTRIILEIHEGRKRQIRRTFEALGYKVARLKRIRYAGLKIDIKEGSYRELTDKEVQQLRGLRDRNVPPYPSKWIGGVFKPRRGQG